MAIEDINTDAASSSLGGAKLEVVLGDAQSTPQAGTAEIEKMNEAGCAAVVGAYAIAICLATTQAAAKYDLPHVVDVGVADQIVERGLKNTFRFGPGYKVCAQIAVNNLHVLNTAAGKPAKTVMIIHEESAVRHRHRPSCWRASCPGYGFEVKEVVKHANPTRDFNNIVLRMKSVNPDIVIPANYYNEYALLVRTMQQQKVVPKAIYSVLGGAASSYKFVKEFPDAADGIIDCNHWFNPKDKRGGRAEASASRRRACSSPTRSSTPTPRCACWPTRSSARKSAPIARPSTRRWRRAPSATTSCRTARRSSSTARTPARSR